MCGHSVYRCGRKRCTDDFELDFAHAKVGCGFGRHYGKTFEWVYQNDKTLVKQISTDDEKLYNAMQKSCGGWSVTFPGLLPDNFMPFYYYVRHVKNVK